MIFYYRGETFNYGGILSCSGISTYPTIRGSRQGDPICDHWCTRLYNNCSIVCLCDGCGWGPQAQQAAIKASRAFVEYINDNLIFDIIEDVGHHLLLAASAAHNAIIKGYEDDIWSAKSTTILGGILVPLQPLSPDEPRYGFTFISIGDCKAFYYSKRTGDVTDLTAGNRHSVTDATDPGGRIGPWIGEGAPDLRNLKLYFVGCNVGDIVFLATDGVHDNFDPQQLGKLPKEVSTQLEGEDWKEYFGNSSADKVKNTFRVKLLRETIHASSRDVTPVEITSSVINHCVNLTKKCRDFMENNPQIKKQPSDIKEYPGKFDHTTIVALSVGSPK